MACIYLETSIISYLTARPSRDVVVVANQQLTNDWWTLRRRDFELYSSVLTADEAAQGDAEAAQKRLAILRDLPLLTIIPEALELAESLLNAHAMPAKAADDAMHVAVATVYGMDYLLTWNCKHIANAEFQVKIVEISRNLGYTPTIICTPAELMGDEYVLERPDY